MLYHVRVLEELGETAEALNLLDINAKSRSIVDRTAIMEFRGEIQLYVDDIGTNRSQRNFFLSLVQKMKPSTLGKHLLNKTVTITTILEDIY